MLSMELQLRSSQRRSDRGSATPVSPSSFVQQGTVDWPTLARASVNASVSVLTRLSGCGVELWTASVAQVILGTIHLSAEGESHLNDALANLHSFGSHSNVIYFGFGVKHIVRTLADSSEGMATVAMCASIAEVHGLAISTQIVQEYAKLYSVNSDGSLMPSFRQWEALTHSCSGVLSRSPFGSVVEFFMKFHPQTHMCADPKQTARALEGLAKISSGLMKSMVLIGNSECGFLAAVAQWLLSLRVLIQNSAGDIVYPSTRADMDDYQLMVIYSEDPEASRAISRTADAYYIDDIKEILPDSVGADYVSGRVEWGMAMRHTFGSSARKLLQIPGILGDGIGSAAKIYSVPSRGIPSESELLRRKSRKFGPEASGRAFVDLVCKQLPEFADSRDAMEIAVERPYDEACLHFEKTMALLKEICGCPMECCPQQVGGPAFIDLTDQVSNNQSKKSAYDPQTCLRVLAHTAIQLVRQMSTVASIPANLYPKRRGLEALYEKVQKHFSDRCNSPNVNVTLSDALDSMGLIDQAILIFGVESPFNYTEKAYGQDRNRASVLVNGGLCFIMDSVIRLSSSAEESLRIHIVPGHVEWNQKTYTKVRDGSMGSPRFIMAPMILPVSKAKHKSQMQLIDNMTARAVVMESSDCLRMSYEIRTASGTFSLSPGSLSSEMAKAATSISCSGKTCRPFIDLEERFLFTLYSMRLPYDGPGNQRIPFDIPEKPNIILFGENELARCTALGDSLFDTKLILQERECIACCARRALMADKPHEHVIISRLTAEDAEELLGRRNSFLLED